MGSCSITGEKIKDYMTGRELPESDDEQIRQKLERILVQKGFSADDVDVDFYFDFEVNGQKRQGRADLVVYAGGKPYMTILCRRGSIVTREKEAIAVSRLAFEYQAPLTVVTNGQDAEIIDSVSGEMLGQGLDSIPDKKRSEQHSSSHEYAVLADDKRDKLSRIYHAYEVFECSNYCPSR